MKLVKEVKTGLATARSSMFDMSTKRVARITVPLSILFFVSSLVVPYIVLFPEVGEQIAIPLHYNIHFGVDLFGPPWRVFTASLVGAVALVLNTILSVIFWRKQRIVSYGLLCATAVVEVVLFVSSAFVTLLVLSFL